ncbi:MAG: thioredoxin domain-containing protein [Anaerolineales bacterium]
MPPVKKPAKRKKKATPPEEESIQFRIKRHHLNAILGLAIGLLLGYLIWGYEQPQAAAPASDVAAQIENLPRHEVTINSDDPVLGPEDAPITIVEFADFECPYCQRYALETHPRLLADFGDQVRFVFKDFPISSIHPNAYPAALAGQCALEQGVFWEYHDLLFSGRLGLERDAFLGYATELGLELGEFTVCLDEERYGDAVRADYNEAAGLGISSTPTFLINGIAVVGAQPYSVFAQIIEVELSQ